MSKPILNPDRHVAGVIRLSSLLDKEVRTIAEKTQQPISQVLNTLVLYALDHMKLKTITICEMQFDE